MSVTQPRPGLSINLCLAITLRLTTGISPSQRPGPNRQAELCHLKESEESAVAPLEIGSGNPKTSISISIIALHRIAANNDMLRSMADTATQMSVQTHPMLFMACAAT